MVRNLVEAEWMDAQEELCEGDFVWICLPLEQETIQTYGETSESVKVKLVLDMESRS